MKDSKQLTPRRREFLAEKIKAKLKGGDLDDIIKFLPAGGGEIKKAKER